jgi:hypothetical protein
VTFPALPCFPCPHHSACCAHGTTLSEEEAAAVTTRYGDDRIYQTRWGEWRTRVKGGRCAFLVDHSCELHDQPFYPLVCRGFPWTDSETGGPYEFDRTICPEFERRPELVTINPFEGRNGGRKG